MADELPKFTAEELKKYNGQDGQPVYVAYQGRVYDVSESKMWRTGTHMKQHSAGEDLTNEVPNAPHGEEVFERFTPVGVVAAQEEEAVAAEDEYDHLPGFLARLMGKVPFLERHPHPMTVHFPIVFGFAAAVFAVVYLITGDAGFDVATLYMLGGYVLFSLIVIPTGLLTWWVNYRARWVRKVTIKVIGSVLALLIAAGAFAWRLAEPTVLTSMEGTDVLYLVLILLLMVVVSVVASLGALLTYPVPAKVPSRKELEEGQATPGGKDEIGR